MQAQTVANKRIGQFDLKKIKTRLRAMELRKAILRAQNHRGKSPEPDGVSIWSAAG